MYIVFKSGDNLKLVEKLGFYAKYKAQLNSTRKYDSVSFFLLLLVFFA